MNPEYDVRLRLHPFSRVSLPSLAQVAAHIPLERVGNLITSGEVGPCNPALLEL
jgi:hypothetical protein